MTDREEIIANLPRGALNTLRAIEAAVGDGSSAPITRLDFELNHRVNHRTLSAAVPLLIALGLIETEVGPQRTRIFRLSRRWCVIGKKDARAALAKTSRPSCQR